MLDKVECQPTCLLRLPPNPTHVDHGCFSHHQIAHTIITTATRNCQYHWHQRIHSACSMLFKSVASLWMAATRHHIYKSCAPCQKCLASFIPAASHPVSLFYRPIHTSSPLFWTARRAREPVMYTPTAAMAVLTTLGTIDPGSGVQGPDLWARVQQHPDFEKFNRRYMRRVRGSQLLCCWQECCSITLCQIDNRCSMI